MVMGAKVINWCCNPCSYETTVQNEVEAFDESPSVCVYMHVVESFTQRSYGAGDHPVSKKRGIHLARVHLLLLRRGNACF